MSLASIIAVKVAVLLLFVLFIDWLRCKWDLENFNRSFVAVYGVLILVMISLVWLAAIRESQFAPHLVTSHIGRNVIAQNWVTNPAYLAFEYRTVPTSNGLQSVAVPVTNYYWRQWSIFK